MCSEAIKFFASTLAMALYNHASLEVLPKFNEFVGSTDETSNT